MTKPFLLMDVDGVLNCVGSKLVEFEDEFQKEWRMRLLMIQIPVGTKDRLHRLAEVFEMHWATMWEDSANIDLHPYLGFVDPWPFIEWDSHQKQLLRAGLLMEESWKLLDIKRYVGEDQPFAWVDDDIQEDARVWVAQRPGPSLLLQTNEDMGLTEVHVSLLLEFAEGLNENDGEPEGEHDPALD